MKYYQGRFAKCVNNKLNEFVFTPFIVKHYPI